MSTKDPEADDVQADAELESTRLSRRNIITALAGSVGVGALAASCGSAERNVESPEGGVGNTPDAVRSHVSSVRDFGAVGDGVTDDTQAVRNAIRSASSIGGGIVKGRLGDTYLLTEDITITTSDLTIDWQWATLTGEHRFIFNGDSGVHGDRSLALRSVHFRNVYLRSVNDQPTPKGPKLSRSRTALSSIPNRSQRRPKVSSSTAAPCTPASSPVSSSTTASLRSKTTRPLGWHLIILNSDSGATRVRPATVPSR